MNGYLDHLWYSRLFECLESWSRCQNGLFRRIDNPFRCLHRLNCLWKCTHCFVMFSLSSFLIYLKHLLSVSKVYPSIYIRCASRAFLESQSGCLGNPAGCLYSLCKCLESGYRRLDSFYVEAFLSGYVDSLSGYLGSLFRWI